MFRPLKFSAPGSLTVWAPSGRGPARRRAPRFSDQCTAIRPASIAPNGYAPARDGHIRGGHVGALHPDVRVPHRSRRTALGLGADAGHSPPRRLTTYPIAAPVPSSAIAACKVGALCAVCCAGAGRRQSVEPFAIPAITDLPIPTSHPPVPKPPAVGLSRVGLRGHWRRGTMPSCGPGPTRSMRKTLKRWRPQ